MNILLLGSGGREHAMALALSESKSCDKLYCAPGNPGMAKLAENVKVDYKNEDEIVKFCNDNKIELVVVGPEQPLADGVADMLTKHSISCFGPNKFAAQLESSKGFAKNFMKRYSIPTAEFKTFTAAQAAAAHSYINRRNFPIVLKADGLAGGKGVLICDNPDEAHDALNEMYLGQFGDASKTVVIEDFMVGEEASVFAVCDGTDYITMATSQDHKRAYDNDEGPNTGGMGAYSPAPVVTDSILDKVKKEIIEPVLKGMKSEESEFRGCLYVGLMIDGESARVVEFNVRFGDPETEVVLPLFKGDLAKLFKSAADGNIDKSSIESIQDQSACTIILASKGYPGAIEKGFEITGINDAEDNGALVFQAGTKADGNKILTNGGRVLAVTAIADDIKSAIEKAYECSEKIKFDNKFNRTDIGKRALK